MSTHTNVIRPESKINRNTRNNIWTIVTVALVLVTAVAITSAVTSQQVAETSPAVAYSNALELQYAQPWIDAQNKSAVAFGNALEMQYAQPFIDAQNRPAVAYSNSLEMQYAQPWLVTESEAVAYGNALEMQYAQPWIQNADLSIAVTGGLDCHSSLEMLYACQAQNVRP
jgi:hypothetical protein